MAASRKGSERPKPSAAGAELVLWPRRRARTAVITDACAGRNLPRIKASILAGQSGRRSMRRPDSALHGGGILLLALLNG